MSMMEIRMTYGSQYAPKSFDWQFGLEIQSSCLCGICLPMAEFHSKMNDGFCEAEWMQLQGRVGDARHSGCS